MIRLLLPLPPSTNDLYERALGFTKRGKPYRATRLKPKVEAYRWLVVQAVNQQLTPEERKTVPPQMSITVYLLDGATKMDADNCLKSVIDAVKCPLGFDDNLKRVRRVTAEYVPVGPPCVVVIEEV